MPTPDHTVTFTPADLDAYTARKIREAWPWLAESATYWKNEHDRMLADFQEMAKQLNEHYEGSRLGANQPLRRHV